MRTWSESVVGTPGAWGKKARLLDASPSPGHPQPLPADGKSLPAFSPLCQVSQRPILKARLHRPPPFLSLKLLTPYLV